MEHQKLQGLMTDAERIARVASAGLLAAQAKQTAPSGAISLDNADGTRTIIGEVVNGESNPSYTMATHVGDTTPPGVPTGITATSKSGVVVVEWDGTLSGGIPDDFFCVRVYLDNVELGALTEAGSVASAKLDGGTTVLVTATSEDDCCLPDGTPDHNVSAASQAISITVTSSAAEIIVDVEDEIEGVRQEIQDFKDEVDADYYTAEEVDEQTQAITREVGAVYRDSMARNLSPFYAHDFTDVSTTDAECYWHTLTTAKTEQLSDGWAHVTLDNSAGTGAIYAYATVRTPFLPIVAGTLMVEIRNVQVAAEGRWGIGRTVQGLTFTALDVTEDGTYYRPCTVNDPTSAVALSLRFYAFAGVSVELDARISYYQGEYTGAYKPYNADTANLTRDYATKTWTKQTAEDYSIGAAQKYTATIANPNLSPFFDHPGGSYASRGATDYWTSELSPYGSVEQYRAGVDVNGSAIGDGWAHYEVERDGLNASSAATTSFCNLRCYRAPYGEWKAGTRYTLLAEFRNVTFLDGDTRGRLVFRPVRKSTASTFSIFESATDVQSYVTEGVTLRIQLKTYDELTDARTQVLDGFFGFSVGCRVAFDVRLSIYENAIGEDGKPITYEGPWKPYVTGQDALSKEYTTKSELTVGLKGIRTEVSQTYETQSHAGTTYSTKSEVQQTVSGLDTRISANATAISGEVTARETLIRQYANGVLVCKVGETVGALVNASGSFDVVSVTWSGNEPTVGTTAASFTATDLLLGLQANDASVSLLGGTGSLSASNDWTEEQVYGLTLRGPDALGIHTGSSRAVGMTMEKSFVRWITEEGPRVRDDSYLSIKAPHVHIMGGDDHPISIGKNAWDTETGEMTGPATMADINIPADDVVNLDGFSIGHFPTTDPTTQKPMTKWGTFVKGLYFGTKVVNPNNSQTMTLFTAAECKSMFGRALSQTKDVIIVQNGDTDAYAGQITGGTNASGALTATINPTKSGAIRYQYIVILGA